MGRDKGHGSGVKSEVGWGWNPSKPDWCKLSDRRPKRVPRSLHWWPIIWKLNKVICGNPHKFSSQTPNLTREKNIHPSRSCPTPKINWEGSFQGYTQNCETTWKLYPKVSHVINILDESLPSLSETVHFCCQVNASAIFCVSYSAFS